VEDQTISFKLRSNIHQPGLFEKRFVAVGEGGATAIDKVNSPAD
jgi:hypothetical protein